MIEKVQVNRCTCWCGHTWLTEIVPKRCAGKGKHRDWNSRDTKSKIVPIEEEVKRIVPDLEVEDPFAEPETTVAPIKTPAKQDPKITDILAQMASKLGRPGHAPTCTCFICKPPKDKK